MNTVIAGGVGGADDGTRAATHPGSEDMIWTDKTRSVAERVEALLADLSLHEKVAQLGSVWPKGPKQTIAGERIDYQPAPGLETDLANRATLQERIALGVGHVARGYGGWPQTAADGCANTRNWQHRVRENSPHDIPALVHEEAQTGFLTWGATAYPTSLAWGATFDPELAEQVASAIGDDLARAGVDQVLAPVIDVIADYRWGRCEECYGEDPYLVSTMGAAYVRGVQSGGVLATLKHFAGHAASLSGRNHASVSIGRRELEDVHMPPFEMAIREAGAASVMNSYAALDGEMPAASKWLLTDVLRGRWGFEGTVSADYNAVANLVFDNFIAADADEAGMLALAAGMDVELPDTSCYYGLAELVADGRLDEALVDRAVRRVLTHKVQRGLLDADYDPDATGDPTLDVDSPRNRDLARRLAEESIVLLSNPVSDAAAPLLPLAPGIRVAVIGPTADFGRAHLGCYAFPNHAGPGFRGDGDRVGMPITTIREALAAVFDVSYAPGVPFEALRPPQPLALRPHEIVDPGAEGIVQAAAAASDADVAVVCVGDIAGMFGGGTSGEGCDVESLRLPGRQHALLEAVLATGTPVVVIVVSGRPYALGEYAERAGAMIQAFFPGVEGGPALARVLTGEVNPSGHLPVQIPRTQHQTRTYLGGRMEKRHFVSTANPTPLYPFGHGLSYTGFEVGELVLSADEVPTDGSITASVRVSNTGDRAGATVVQLYLTDAAAQVQQPTHRLVGYARVALGAGESRQVAFELHTDRLSFTGVDYTRIVEPGRMTLSAGLSAGELASTASFMLTGAVRVVPEGRVLGTPVSLSQPPPVSLSQIKDEETLA
ncbi:glycoside hydrolase family 3 N-terminal domain-containing protein [Humibacter antri]